ncbi:MAG: CDGSH iron-sulfur domain-containing protein [Anaerolineales bacterium]
MSQKLTLTARENGPYLIPAQATYTDADGQTQTTSGTMIALCRCGGSGNKPFCDGTHKKISFTALAITLEILPSQE